MNAQIFIAAETLHYASSVSPDMSSLYIPNLCGNSVLEFKSEQQVLIICHFCFFILAIVDGNCKIVICLSENGSFTKYA